MKITRLAAIPLGVAFAAAAFSAHAADMFLPKQAPAAYAPLWSGFYVGVNGGYGWNASASTLDASAYSGTTAEGSVLGLGSNRLGAEGGFGGGQIGFNVQRSSLVFGVEADFQGAGFKHSTSTLADGVDDDTDHIMNAARAVSNLDWFGTLRGRLGYSMGQTLVYATGGLAFGGVRDSLTWSLDGSDTGPGAVEKNTTLTGYTIGGGAETKLSPAWSLKAEYQYIDLGTVNLSGTSTATNWEDALDGVGTASVKIRHDYHTVRLGLNYKVNQPVEPLK